MPHVPDTGPGKRVTGAGARTEGREAGRQISEVGAVCGKAARTVLCGERSVTGVPTAIGVGIAGFQPKPAIIALGRSCIARGTRSSNPFPSQQGVSCEPNFLEARRRKTGQGPVSNASAPGRGISLLPHRSVRSIGESGGPGERDMLEDRFLKRLSKKARKGLRGWPIATIAFYGPNLSQATKVAVGIVLSENAAVEELRDWKVDRGDIRADFGIAREILEFIEKHQARSVAMTDRIIGCPHQEGIDYEGEWCPVCEFWHGRDRFTGQRVH